MSRLSPAIFSFIAFIFHSILLYLPSLSPPPLLLFPLIFPTLSFPLLPLLFLFSFLPLLFSLLLSIPLLFFISPSLLPSLSLRLLFYPPLFSPLYLSSTLSSPLYLTPPSPFSTSLSFRSMVSLKERSWTLPQRSAPRSYARFNLTYNTP